MLGYDSTVPVTMGDMLRHTQAVIRGTQHALVVVDMPFMSYQADEAEALRNAGRLMKHAGAQAVKLEGGTRTANTIKAIVDCGIPVMGHIGLTPQSVNQLGGYRVQGKTPKAAAQLLRDALALEEAGVFAIVLECVPTPLAQIITQRCTIPTIGIGAGPYCDGQVQVLHDMLGLIEDFSPKHAKKYAHLSRAISEAVTDYAREVTKGDFPTEEHSFTMNSDILTEISRETQPSS
jgi:3-methyl-2-oxobutanoate hydroxymethyltransferase